MTTFRQLYQKDFRATKQIYKDAFDLYEHPISDFSDSWNLRSEENSYGIYLDSTLIGFAICSFDSHSGANMYLDYIAIDTGYKGKGYGSMLLNTLLDKCSRDHRSIHLFPDSFDLVQWYKKFGFYETADSDPLPGKPPFYLNLSPYPRRR